MSFASRVARVGLTIGAAVVLLGGVLTTSAFAMGASFQPEQPCYGCNVDAYGHHCFQVAVATESGKTVCSASSNQCTFSGVTCGSVSAMLPTDGAVYLAASGSFALSDEASGPGEPGLDGYLRICSGVIVDRSGDSSPAPLDLTF